MLEIFLTPKAESDLAEIYEYSFNNWGIDQADKYQDELYAGFKTIAEHPEIGNGYPFHNKDYRKLHVNRHLIFYRISNNELLIIRILYDEMDISKRL